MKTLRRFRVLLALLTTLSAHAFQHSASADVDRFTLLSAVHANRIEEGYPYYPALQGETADIPSHFRTEDRGRLLIAHPNLQLELQERSEVSLENTVIWQEGRYRNRFLTSKSPKKRASSFAAPLLTLHRGAVLLQTTAQPILVQAGEVTFEASTALFSLSTAYVRGQHLSVTRGEVKVTDTDHSIRVVSAGQTLVTGESPNVQFGSPLKTPPASELPQRLSLLGQTTKSLAADNAFSNVPTPPSESPSTLEEEIPSTAAVLSSEDNPNIKPDSSAPLHPPSH